LAITLAPFAGIVWRILDARLAHDPCAAARAPEGRFHHSGQRALYASLTAAGAGVAIARYVRENPGPRVIAPLHVDLARVRDLRAEPAPERASVVWQELRASGAPSPTWALSDAARDLGTQAMLYPSRSRPDLTHIVVFDWIAGLTVRPAGPARPWHPGPDG